MRIVGMIDGSVVSAHVASRVGCDARRSTSRNDRFVEMRFEQNDGRDSHEPIPMQTPIRRSLRLIETVVRRHDVGLGGDHETACIAK
jgi:hypothetical protein